MVAQVAAQRVRLRVKGVVQGVGFRPFVYRLAHEHHLGGFVGNDSSGVFIEVEGAPDDLTRFQQRLTGETPPLARIDTVDAHPIPACGGREFVIVHSQPDPHTHTLISPDLCICEDCLRELFDPANRRYRYPFINCTNCGPRFTITRDVPYDRPLTTMAAFELCPACQQEYDNPLDRRFHAQPNACPDCGPQVTFVGAETISGDAAIEQTITALAAGQIVAVKGIGGFHLACDATNHAAVQRLRERKQRPAKPFALMARDVEQVRQFAAVTDEEAAMLTSRERPVVLLNRLKDTALSGVVAPGTDTVGVMLPYTPLHYLIVGDTPLVMTSANISGEPIIKDDDDAQARLGGIADDYLLHNREIHVHCDDSVVRVDYPIRRSRGYAPFPVRLPFEVGSVFAVGGELKSTFCLTQGRHAFMSQHIGDMQNLETLHAFEHAFEHMQALFRAQPEAVICDIHPGYLSSQWAQTYAAAHGLPLVQVQHHHAHIAAVMAENGLPADASVIGFSFDGTGYGTDGAVWGGELLIAGYRDFQRAAHLAYMPMPGGDAAVKRPYRLALAYLWACGLPWRDDLPPVQYAPPAEQRILRQQLEKNLNTAQTSSMGRLFDAVAALLGVCGEASYEGQAAIELEAVAAAGITEAYPFGFHPQPLLGGILADMQAGVPVPMIAAKFHNSIANQIVAMSLYEREQDGLNTVALSGGVFQNVRLLHQAVQQLEHHQFNVLVHRVVPPNDGGLALGQAVIGHFRS